MSATISTLDAVRSFKSNAWTSAERAHLYDQTTSSKSDITHFLTTEYIAHLTRRIGPKSRVLDLGCGTGVLTKALAALGFDVTGVDISREMLDKIRPESEGDRITLREGNVYALPFEDGRFDGITTRWVLPHFRDWPTILKEAARVLRPEGVIVFDHSSRANYELAASVGAVDYPKFGYDNRVDGDRTMFYASASTEELQMAADVAGLELIDARPLGFFRQNAVFAAALGGDGFLAYKQDFDAFYQDEGVRAFVQWFERHVTRALPQDMVNGMAVIMRKRSA